MAANDQNTGNLFEGLVSAESDKEKLLSAFSDIKLQIVSPTVAGLLSGLGLESYQFINDINIPACNVDFESNTFGDGEENIQTSVSNNNVDNKESESSKEPEFITSLASFTSKVKEIRSSFLPYELYNGATVPSSDFNNISEMESFENAFMRMLGVPDDRDVGGSTGVNGSEIFDSSKKIVYASPKKTEDRIVKNVATLGEITGDSPTTTDRFADILAERQRLPSSTSGWGRYFDFGNVSITTLQNEAHAESTAAKILEASGDTTHLTAEDIALNYYEPNHLFRFYYLKCTPIQSSKIYGCVSEPSKVVSKPFDPSSFSKINGVKPKTSLLETIIRLRLDQITGSPGVYSTTSNQSDTTGENPTTISGAKNVDKDNITQVECFLIQKLRKVLIELAYKYVDDAKSITTHEATENKEKEKVTKNKKPNQDTITRYKSELTNLEMLKAREDAILFLLKDTSSSSNSGNYESAYSSLDLQEGIIRTSSGFNDALSGPLYSILSQRSEYLNKKIRELSELIDKSNTIPTSLVDSSGLTLNPEKQDRNTYSYLGVCSEDFIVYTMALLSLEQDYLIGLLPQKNRVNMAKIISSSILTSNKDPYGIIDRVSKSPADGGFPSVADSVNALAVLVCDFYWKYISIIKNRKKSVAEQVAVVNTITKTNS
jgi:hypothetical protein